MTKTNMDLSELLAKHDQGDFLRGIAEAVLQLIMEADVEARSARDGTNAATNAPPGATGIESARSIPVWAR